MKQYVLCVVGVLALASPAFAQGSAPAAKAKRNAGVWIDINFLAINSAQKEQTYTLTTPYFGEPATATTTYPALPTAYGMGIDGGYMLRNGLGFGVHYTGAKYDSFVGMAIHIPSPAFFNTYANDSATTAQTLERTDREFDIAVSYTPSTPGAWRIRIFGGPSYFTVSQAMVNDVKFTQSFSSVTPTNIVDITGYESDTVSGNTWGFHAGADVAYFFSRHVGAGGVFRVSGGSVEIEEEPLAGGTATLKVGGISMGGGLRIRF